MNNYIKTGDKYNKLIAVKRLLVKDKRNSVWQFKCECGKYKKIIANNVVRGITKSCGCLHKKIMATMTTHGFIQKYKYGTKNPRFYGIWSGMKSRCLDKNCSSYNLYGQKGISVCSQWLKFETFFDDMWKSYNKHVKKYGEKQTTLDRIDYTKGYEKQNCHWATMKEQARNKKMNHLIKDGDKKICLAEFIEKYGINKSKFYRRLKKGLTMENIKKELSTI